MIDSFEADIKARDFNRF